MCYDRCFQYPLIPIYGSIWTEYEGEVQVSNVYVKTKTRSGSYITEYLWKIRKKRALVVCDKFLAESGTTGYILDALDPNNTVGIFD